MEEKFVRIPHFVHIVPDLITMKDSTVFIQLYGIKSNLHTVEQILRQTMRIRNSWNIEHWCFDWTSEDDISVLNKDGTGLIDFFEFFDTKIVKPLVSMGVHTHSIHLIHGDCNIETNYQNYINKTQGATVIGSVSHVPKFFSQYKNIHSGINPTAVNCEPRPFCTFNRRETVYRRELYNFLMVNDLIDLGYCNFKFSDYSNIQETLPSTYEGYDQYTGHNCSTISEQIITGYYQKTNFEIVFETSSDPRNRSFITEKTVRPLAWGMPFVTYNGAGSLTVLRELGFKTYSDFWDESYDTITNGKARFLAVADLAQQLISSAVFADRRNEIAAVNLHNQQNYARIAATDYREVWHDASVAAGFSIANGPWLHSQQAIYNQYKRISR